ncbi:Ankyrin repeat domain-containing protein 17 [Cyberlindnera fabianii]|uniref:Ankyrin repeat domain-containing protein 17 n=1 Tax=Cyberlindnera fabianii TaxID=36022 RepID=A0A1V2LDA7_CYBFA|nr:Ankyrin repeat domain-containing protein 17 [Cyberlindnera fabianii]
MVDYDYTVLGVGVSALLVIFNTITHIKKDKKTKSKSKSKPKLSFVEQVQLQLRECEERVRTKLEKRYIEEFETLKADDKQYKFNYFQEELLKELIRLDGIELSEMNDLEKKQGLKTSRKGLIKYIQGLQKELDAFKRDHKDIQ